MAKNLEYSILLDFYGDMLTEKQQSFAELYYNQDLSLGEISDHEGITRQGVHDNLKRCEEYMDELESKLKLYSKHKNAKKTFTEITTLCKQLREIVEPYKYLTKAVEIIDSLENKLSFILPGN